MTGRLPILVALGVMLGGAACEAPRDAPAVASIPACEGTPVITSDSLGPVAIGATLEQVLARCPNVLRFFEPQEGQYYHALAVRVGAAELRVAIDGDSASALVYRVRTDAPSARTMEGLGPGSLVSAIASTYGPLTYGVGECALVAWGERLPGVSWTIGYPDDWSCSQAVSVGRPGGAVLPESTRVRSVFVRVK